MIVVIDGYYATSSGLYTLSVSECEDEGPGGGGGPGGGAVLAAAVVPAAAVLAAASRPLLVESTPLKWSPL